jgi:hypothetical protein
MQKPFEHMLTESDRAVLANWLCGLLAFYGSVAIVVLGLTLAGISLVPDRAPDASGHGQASSTASQDVASRSFNDISTGMPLP